MAENKFSASDLQALRNVIRRELGLDINPDSIESFSAKIAATARELGYGSTGECLHSLVSSKLSKRQIEVLASHLTVGETYFFRDPKAFELLEHDVLPALIRERRETRILRIWSAACATGEEPYSLAMLLMKILPDWRKWRITILATDINTRFLGKAIKGRYTGWSFRTTPAWAKQRFFSSVSDGEYEIDPDVRRLVTFSYLNLAENIYPSVRNNTNAMDLILCRNVFIYFGKEMRSRVVACMHRSLVDGGCLLVSPVEASRRLFADFEQQIAKDVRLFCKTASRQEKAGSQARVSEIADDPKAQAKNHGQAQTMPVFSPLPETAASPEQAPLSGAPVRGGNFHHAAYLFRLGLYQEAAAELLKCPEDVKVQLLLTRVYANMGEFEEAERWCTRAIVSDPLDAHARYLSASILQEQGKVDDAMEALRHTIYLDQHFILAHYTLASLLTQANKKELAYRYYRNAYQMACGLPDQQVVPESDGLPAGRLADLIRLSLKREYGR